MVIAIETKQLFRCNALERGVQIILAARVLHGETPNFFSSALSLSLLKPIFKGGTNEAGGWDAGPAGFVEERSVRVFRQWEVEFLVWRYAHNKYLPFCY